MVNINTGGYMELMETEEALQIVNVLMKGVNPDTASTLSVDIGFVNLTLVS